MATKDDADFVARDSRSSSSSSHDSSTSANGDETSTTTAADAAAANIASPSKVPIIEPQVTLMNAPPIEMLLNRPPLPPPIPSVPLFKTYVLESMRANLSVIEMELLNRGYRPARKGSTAFDFKWTWSYERLRNLRPYQIVNHFSTYNEIGTKSGLIQNLRRVDALIQHQRFVPRTYLLNYDGQKLHSEHELLLADFDREEMLHRAHNPMCMNERFSPLWSFLPPKQSFDGSHNLWIVKPALGTRGIGIMLINQREDFLLLPHYAMYVVQKYIENPLIDSRPSLRAATGRRKFDIRQFALVTSLRPLTVFLFDQCYLRFCSDEFTLPQVVNPPLPVRFDPSPDDPQYQQLFAHLTNHQVQKNAPTFNQSQTIPEDQMSCAHFRTLLNADAADGEDVWRERLLPQIEDVVVSTLRAWPQDGHRKNSFELLGFDLMIDEQLHVSLIEVNTNPGLHMLTNIVRPHHTRLQQDMIRVVIDRRAAWEDRAFSDGEQLQIGDFRLIYAEKRKRSAMNETRTVAENIV
jgi:tubulin monoglycylase TTLL3/8